MMDISQIPSPCYVLDERLFRDNLSLIRSVKERAGVNIILAFKAFALWKAFPIVREYIPCSTASSLFEARLAYEEMGSPAHTYAPVYTDCASRLRMIWKKRCGVSKNVSDICFPD